jgi:carboxyl-terminal processing protease
MLKKAKVLIFLGSFLVVIYGASAAFLGKEEPYKELSVFMDVLHRVRDDYVEVPNMNNVQEGAMKGLIEALDPYCSFLSKDKYDELQKRKENGTTSIGVVLSKRSDVIYVVSCERNGPAAEAGIRAGDYLIAINGQGVEDKSIIEVDSLLRDADGTKIKATIFRNSRTKPLDVELTLKKPNATPVVSKMLDSKVGLIGISSLSNSSVEQTKIKIKTLISAGAQKLILDLRDCAEGTPSDGATLANFFLSSGVIYFSQNRKGEKIQTVEASSDQFITDLPMVVLIDSSTGGAAEITAGALKDQKRATIVGERSFGIGSSQKIFSLKSGAILILSAAKFCTPNGKIIQQDDSVRNTGILPDVKVPDDEQRQDLAVESYYDDQDDAKYKQIQEKIEKIQLDKALEILSKELVPIKKAA